jgi:hypothetical protein
MNTEYLVRTHDKYMPGLSRVELRQQEHLDIPATLIVPTSELKDFPVGGVISIETKIVAVLQPVKEKPVELTKKEGVKK